jgi:hypothetical protein
LSRKRGLHLVDSARGNLRLFGEVEIAVAVGRRTVAANVLVRNKRVRLADVEQRVPIRQRRVEADVERDGRRLESVRQLQALLSRDEAIVNVARGAARGRNAQNLRDLNPRTDLLRGADAGPAA